MITEVKVENYRKIAAILMFSFLVGGIIFAMVGFVDLFLEESFSAETLIIALVILAILIWSFIYFGRMLINVIVNFNKLCYLKFNKSGFLYLHISHPFSNSKASNLGKMEAMYYKQEFFPKFFHNITRFERNHKNQIIMHLDDKETKTLILQLQFSASKSCEVEEVLNMWLTHYRINK